MAQKQSLVEIFVRILRRHPTGKLSDLQCVDIHIHLIQAPNFQAALAVLEGALIRVPKVKTTALEIASRGKETFDDQLIWVAIYHPAKLLGIIPYNRQLTDIHENRGRFLARMKAACLEELDASSLPEGAFWKIEIAP